MISYKQIPSSPHFPEDGEGINPIHPAYTRAFANDLRPRREISNRFIILVRYHPNYRVSVGHGRPNFRDNEERGWSVLYTDRIITTAALMIVDQCSNVFFDRTKPLDQRPEVMDLFSSAIGHVVRESPAVSFSIVHINLTSSADRTHSRCIRGLLAQHCAPESANTKPKGRSR